MSFERALSIVLESEGGWSNHADDPGGETYMGITARTLAASRARYPDLELPEKVSLLRMEHVQALYDRDYWRVAHCDKLPAPLALLVFDAAVNHGPGVAVRLMQRAAGVPADGAVGPVTLAAVRKSKLPELLTEFCAQRIVLYGRLPTFATFGMGWSRRLFKTFREALAWVDA